MEDIPSEDQTNQMQGETNGTADTLSTGAGQGEHKQMENTDLLEQKSDVLSEEAPRSPNDGAIVPDIAAGIGRAGDKTEQMQEQSKGNEDEAVVAEGAAAVNVASPDNEPAGKTELAKDMESEVIPNVEFEHVESTPQENVSRLEINIGNEEHPEKPQVQGAEVGAVQESKPEGERKTDKEVSKETELEQSNPNYTTTEELEINKSETPEGAIDEEEDKAEKEGQDLQDKSMDIAETSGTDSPMNSVPSLPDDAASSGPNTPKDDDEHFLKDETAEHEHDVKVISESEKGAQSFFASPDALSVEIQGQKTEGVEENETLRKLSMITEAATETSIESTETAEHPSETATPIGTDESLDASTVTPQQDVTEDQVTSHGLSEDTFSAQIASTDDQNQLQPPQAGVVVTDDLIAIGNEEAAPPTSTASEPAEVTPLVTSEQPPASLVGDFGVTDDLIVIGNEEAAPSPTSKASEPPKVTPPVTPEQPSDSLVGDSGEQRKDVNTDEIVDIKNQETSPVEKIEAMPDVLPIPVKSTPAASKVDEESRGVIDQSKEPSQIGDNVDELQDEASTGTSMETPLLRERRSKKNPFDKEEYAAATDKPAAVVPTTTDFEQPGSTRQDEKAPLVKSTDDGKTYGTSVDEPSKRSDSPGLFERIRTLANAYCNIL